MEELVNYIKDHFIEALGLLIAYFSLIVPIQQYLGQRRVEEKDKRFNNYHRLIKELVSPDSQSQVIMIDRQIAVIFELRNYSDYYELSKRILEDLKTIWQPHESSARLINEIELTLRYIDNRS